MVEHLTTKLKQQGVMVSFERLPNEPRGMCACLVSLPIICLSRSNHQSPGCVDSARSCERKLIHPHGFPDIGAEGGLASRLEPIPAAQLAQSVMLFVRHPGLWPIPEPFWLDPEGKHSDKAPEKVV